MHRPLRIDQWIATIRDGPSQGSEAGKLPIGRKYALSACGWAYESPMLNGRREHDLHAHGSMQVLSQFLSVR